MTNPKFGLKFLTAAALVAGTVLVAGCDSDKETKTTTTEQSSTTTKPMPPTTYTTTTTSTEQSRP